LNRKPYVPASGVKPATAIEVVCAIIRRDDRVLLAKRPAGKRLGGLWEFPGGKVEPGEEPAAALRREIHEELGCEVRVMEALEPCAHEYEWGGILLLPFVCEIEAGSAEPVAHEHEEIVWVRVDEIAVRDVAAGGTRVTRSENPCHFYELAPADVPVVAMLKEIIS
jgi:8-oxo-dGTP diphosphatase